MGQYAGELIGIEQVIANSFAGELIGIEQTIVFRNSFSGELIAIEQIVSNRFSGELIAIEQRVVDPLVISNVTRYGWDAFLTIGGISVEPVQLHGTIDITRSENSAALMDFTLINKTGIIDFNQWHGKTVTLDIETASGVTRAYTGTVDIPEVDVINKLIKLRCTDKRKEQINNQLSSQLPFIGKRSAAIFDDPEDVADELSQRLQTTTKTVDFDAYGNFTISDFLAKAVPDFTLVDNQIFRRKPQLQVASRGRLINRVNLDFEFRYVRLRHRKRSFFLEGPTFCDVMTTIGLAFISVDSIQSNLDSFGWQVDKNDIDYTFLPDAGIYNCGIGDFIWSPIQHRFNTTNVTDSDGNIVKDSNGNTVTQSNRVGAVNYTQAFATDVTWRAVKQFAQDISQKTMIQINAPQSQAQYDIIEKSQRNGLDVEFDSSEFEKNEAYKAAPADFISTATDSYQDQYGSLQDYQEAIETILAMGQTQIAKSHRDNHVIIQVPIWPEIDLKHTLEIAATDIQAKGKVTQVRHTLNIADRSSETQVKISLSQSVGNAADTALSIPITAAPLVGDDYTGTLKMRTYGDYQVAIGGQSITKELGMVTPAIDDESRNRQEIAVSYSANVSVRNDLLQVIF